MVGGGTVIEPAILKGLVFPVVLKNPSKDFLRYYELHGAKTVLLRRRGFVKVFLETSKDVSVRTHYVNGKGKIVEVQK